MTPRHHRPRHCRRGGRFSWSRVIDDEGCIVYRLFWRDATERVYMESRLFEPFWDRRQIAYEVRKARHNASVMRKALRITA